jgi:hypothetical protein
VIMDLLKAWYSIVGSLHDGSAGRAQRSWLREGVSSCNLAREVEVVG